MTPGVGASDFLRAIDLLRTVPGPGDAWDWLLHSARDVGLCREDLAGLSFREAALLVRLEYDFWHFGKSPFLADALTREPAYMAEERLRMQLVQLLGLPVLAHRLSSAELLQLAEEYYERDPFTWELRRNRAFTLEVDVPFSPTTHTYRMEATCTPSTTEA